MKLLFRYLADKRRLLLGLLFCAALIYGVYFLFDLPLLPFWYIVTLCLFTGCIILILDFSAFRQKHLVLTRLLPQIEAGLEYLPRSESILERDYQALLQELAKILSKRTGDASRREQEAIEYYTLWAHQIKTPIAAMHLLLQEQLPDRDALEDELFRISQYTEMVLCYLRLEGETTDYVIGEYDLDAILRQAVDKHGSKFSRRGLVLQYEPVEAVILTDEKWFLFVVEQILSNALKYTRSGTVTVRLSAPKVLSIQDTGMGIAQEDLPRIFERGFTGCNGRIDKQATGIGLYLCRRICGNLGHKITAQSQVGIGTEIQIDFSRTSLEIE